MFKVVLKNFKNTSFKKKIKFIYKFCKLFLLFKITSYNCFHMLFSSFLFIKYIENNILLKIIYNSLINILNI
jgi:hypothetical protein